MLHETPRGSLVAPTPRTLPEGVVAEIPLDDGIGALGIVSDGQSMWVTSHRGTTLYKIDPNTNTVSARIDIGQEACGWAESGFGRVWLMPCDNSTQTLGVDTTSDTVTGSIDVMSNLGLGRDVMWATATNATGSQLDKVDTITVKPTTSMPIKGQYDTVIAFDDQVWGMSSADNVIDRLDPATAQVIVSVPTPLPSGDSFEGIGFAGALWVKGYKTSQLVRVDLASNTATAIDLPGYVHPSGYYDTPPVSALGDLWLRISDSAVAQLDPASGTIKATYPADKGGGDVAVAFGSLWVANFNESTVWRIRLTP